MCQQSRGPKEKQESRAAGCPDKAKRRQKSIGQLVQDPVSPQSKPQTEDDERQIEPAKARRATQGQDDGQDSQDTCVVCQFFKRGYAPVADTRRLAKELRHNEGDQMGRRKRVVSGKFVIRFGDAAGRKAELDEWDQLDGRQQESQRHRNECGSKHDDAIRRPGDEQVSSKSCPDEGHIKE